ncbi:LPS assembly protein LptD [Granulicella sp. WH15]|uniref:LPS-assembly protein LptD n=1 Tax=Granulicella sp. WH15 TaxID=2602070 RepID=UPI0021067CCB|nr:LPS assembly protein LptD [Granulicella sp. WH15]
MLTFTSASATDDLPEGPDQIRYPVAHVVPPADDSNRVRFESATQSEQGGVYTLDGHVVVTYRDRVIEADHMVYDRNTDLLTATGHLVANGGPNQEHIEASHGTVNLKAQTGRFYDVNGSVGVKKLRTGITVKTVYTNSNPLLFTGHLVVRTGPQEYEVYDGTVTSCLLPNPDWLLSAAHFSVDSEKARAKGSIFHLLNFPLIYLPYVTHPTNAEPQSGFMIPIIEQSSIKGLVIGESIYLVLNRSADLLVGAEYYSQRGFAQNVTFRYRGRNLDFVTAHYNGLLDRRPPGPTNEGGEDALVSARHDLGNQPVDAPTRFAANVEYLSSYVYRQVFAPTFNQAVTSDVVSTAYAVHQWNGIEAAGVVDRYQGIKLVQLGSNPGEQVRIFHAPSVDLDTTEHRLGATGLYFTMESSLAGLKRSQPNFATGGIVERFDLHPELIYPLHFAGWNMRASAGVRETVYSRGREASSATASIPVQSMSAVNRADFEGQFELRPPVVERTFETGWLPNLLKHEVRHTIEPELTYRYVSGVDNFMSLLRFDATDVVSDTNELEYGVTQRLFVKPRAGKQCSTDELAQGPGLDSEETSDAISSEAGPEVPHKGCGNEELISWRLTQKSFFNQDFGGAILVGRRNLFDTTLGLSGVAFLTEPRQISPLISRLRVRTSAKTDIEWDFDYDTGAKKFTSNNFYMDLHQGKTFGALSYARLDAPGRFYTEGVSSSVSNFSQMRLLLGYGMPTKPGLSVAANAGIDLNSGTNTSTTPATATSPAITTTTTSPLIQYAALQTSYNWNCCGLSIEYRKYELGADRNENTYRFSFTLVNIGAAGNLRRAERLF